MSQWIDMWSVENQGERKELQVEGLKESIAMILSIIRSNAALVPTNHIILSGINQGCTTAIHALLHGRV